jgi:hypothetical protein
MMTARRVEYILEIYEPGSADDVSLMVTTSQPPAAISQGDLLSPFGWHEQQSSAATLLRVTSVEHIIWETGSTLKHKLCIFTEEVDNTRDIRLSGGD